MVDSSLRLVLLNLDTGLCFIPGGSTRDAAAAQIFENAARVEEIAHQNYVKRPAAAVVDVDNRRLGFLWVSDWDATE